MRHWRSMGLAGLLVAWMATSAAAGDIPTDKLNAKFDTLVLTDLSGKPFKLADLPPSKATVVAFLSFECPVCNSYMSALNELKKEYGTKCVNLLAVVASDDSPDAIQAAATKYHLSWPLFRDANSEAADSFKATTVPEVFVLDAGLTLRYRGRIDDTYAARLKKNHQVTQHNLKDALDAVMAGQTVRIPATKSVGCSIPARERKVATSTAVTYHRDIAPILQTHCQGCHRPNQAGPFSLTSYKHALNWADDIREYTQNRKMPPWKPAPGPEYHNSRAMPDADIAKIAAWVSAGCPEGNPSEGPKPKSFPTDWQLGTPDLILEVPEDMHVAATGKDLFRCFVFPTGFKEDMHIVGYEVRPGTAAVVHHSLNYYDTTGKARELAERERKRIKDPNEPDHGPGYSVAMGLGFLPDMSKFVPGQAPPIGMFGGWAPGQQAQSVPEGSAYLLPKGADVVLQVHYHRTGKPETDRTKIGIYFAKKPVERVFQVLTVGGMSPITMIPAGRSDYKAKGSVWLTTDATIHSVLPHMHLIGRSIKVSITEPGKPTWTLVDIPDWDYNWQESYWLKTPKVVPAGTRIDVEAVYDNSSKNPHNPSSPPRAVFFGEETTSEMLYGFVGVTPVNTPRVRLNRQGPAGTAPELKKADAGVEIPYRLTDTKHVLVRVKMNGQGPFNFILDTGAPMMVTTKAVAKSIGATPDRSNWAKLDKLVIEGGLNVDKARVRVEDLFQLEGMNGLGLAGVELHGVIGYEVLALFRITYDFTRDKLTWVPLPDYNPPPLQGIGGRGGQGGLEILGPLMKVLGGIMGIKADFDVFPRGFLGITLKDADGKVTVDQVLADGPAAKAGLQPGDVIAKLKGSAVESSSELLKLAAKVRPGDTIRLSIVRSGETKTVSIVLGKGL